MLHIKFAATHACAMCSSTLAIYMSVYVLHVTSLTANSNMYVHTTQVKLALYDTF